jgi:hypothetical protein
MVEAVRTSEKSVNPETTLGCIVSQEALFFILAALRTGNLTHYRKVLFITF